MIQGKGSRNKEIPFSIVSITKLDQNEESKEILKETGKKKWVRDRSINEMFSLKAFL